MGGGRPEEPDKESGQPEAFGGLRWEQVPGSPDGGHAWLTGSPSARRIANGLAVADTAGVAVAVTLIAASVVRGRPADGVNWLWVPGIVLVAAGQLWALLVIRARKPPGGGRRWLAVGGVGGSIGRGLREYFGRLDRRITMTVVVLCFTGSVSFFTGIVFIRQGTPVGPGDGCAYRVGNGSFSTCVSKTAYDLAGAAQQRMVAGVFLLFLAMHLYAALASGRGEYVS